MHSMPFGAEVCADGAVRFRIWAPAQREMKLRLDSQHDALTMRPLDDGWHELVTHEARVGSRYSFLLESGIEVPDPASRHQPEDTRGPSEVIDPRAYEWKERAWRGRPWESAVLYELHVGAFTPEGTFRAVIDKLDHLVDLGVTAIELMPVADFPGRWNWGYDGVLLFAPDASYGRPEDLKALIDAAHARGLMVFLDVVYNHFGPLCNHLSAYAPQFFTSRHKTPWGDAIDYDGPSSPLVRSFMIHNALYWIEEYCLDGLRLDAVHAIADDSSTHVLEELAERVQEFAAREGRRVHLVLENEANQVRLLERTPVGQPRWYAAQWNDDVHHCLHVAVTGESGGYYEDYADTLAMLVRALCEGFVYQGEPSVHQGGKLRGEVSRHLPPAAFVSFIQNHDQIGNRAFGERLTQIAPPEAVRAAAAIYLLAPSIPLLFMGEEWAAGSPFAYFCDLEELAEAIREGRRQEFAKFPEFQDARARERIPDPTAPETFFRSRLDWQELGREPHRSWRDWYRTLLRLRREMLIARQVGASQWQARGELIGERGLQVSWQLPDASRLALCANLGGADLAGFAPPRGHVFFSQGPNAAERLQRGTLGPWSVVWALETC
ncbi:MAG TPA: malto-oligosyltrehalose trehalohydrolase [Steroidobacter sp.]